MGIGRTKALERINELIPRVEEHLRRIAANPQHTSLNHYRHEVRNWLQQMEAMLRHVGQKTAAQWAPRLRTYREALGEDDAPTSPTVG